MVFQNVCEWVIRGIVIVARQGPLFEDSIELNAYPPEYIFSEKFESIIYLDEINGRMKDYYDCFKLVSEKVLNIKELKIAIENTFSTRETKLKGAAIL